MGLASKLQAAQGAMNAMGPMAGQGYAGAAPSAPPYPPAGTGPYPAAQGDYNRFSLKPVYLCQSCCLAPICV
jgi:hypothetical protein